MVTDFDERRGVADREPVISEKVDQLQAEPGGCPPGIIEAEPPPAPQSS